MNSHRKYNVTWNSRFLALSLFVWGLLLLSVLSDIHEKSCEREKEKMPGVGPGITGFQKKRTVSFLGWG